MQTKRTNSFKSLLIDTGFYDTFNTIYRRKYTFEFLRLDLKSRNKTNGNSCVEFIQLPEKLKASHSWHPNIKYGDVICIWPELCQCFLRGGVRIYVHTMHLKSSFQNLDYVMVIIDQKYITSEGSSSAIGVGDFHIASIHTIKDIKFGCIPGVVNLNWIILCNYCGRENTDLVNWF